MGEVKQINMKNGTYYFYNNIIDLKDFEPNLLKIDKMRHKGINIYYIGYITIKKTDDYEIIKINSDDDLTLNKPLKFHVMTIIIRSVFEEDGKFYPQLFLDDTLYEL